MGYYVEPSGFIQFQGAATHVYTNVNNSEVFQLPPGHRPATPVTFSVPRIDGNIYEDAARAQVYIHPNGAVELHSAAIATNGATWDLSAARFRIGN